MTSTASSSISRRTGADGQRSPWMHSFSRSPVPTPRKKRPGIIAATVAAAWATIAGCVRIVGHVTAVPTPTRSVACAIAQHGPDHRRLALARRPGVEVVGHGDEVEARPLGLDRRLHEEVGPVLLGREVQAELHAGHWRFAIASASSVLLMFERPSTSSSFGALVEL